MCAKNYILTPEGARKLREKLSELERELAAALREKGEAAETGGNVWHDNFAFEQLVQKEQMLMSQIAELKGQLEAAEVKGGSVHGTGGAAKLGSRVLVEFADGKRAEFTIGDPEIADPAQGIISYESPLGAALLGARAGARRRYRTSGGEKEVMIAGVF